jgi:hypothetical protein
MTERRLDFRLYTLPTTVGPITRLLNTESRYEASLNFWDVPGEVYDGDIPPNILREMTRARGLILLINPSFVPDEGRERYYMRFFDRTLGRLKFALADAARKGDRVPFDPRTNQLTIPWRCASARSTAHRNSWTPSRRRCSRRRSATRRRSLLVAHDVRHLQALGVRQAAAPRRRSRGARRRATAEVRASSHLVDRRADQ